MNKILLLLTLTTNLLGQNFLPTKDSTVNNPDGSITNFQVLPHAIFMTTMKDGKWNGPFKSFYKNGKLWHSDNRIDNKIEGVSYDFTPNGDTAQIEIWKNSNPITVIIFYSSTIYNPQKYYFVSKKGFTLRENGKPTRLNESTPDSLIENQGTCLNMWIKGKRELFYGECTTFEIIKTGGKPGLYKIKGNSKEFIRPLTEEEKKRK